MKLTALAVMALVLGLATGCTVDESAHVRSAGPSAGAGHDASGDVDWHMGAPAGAEPMRDHGQLVPVAASWAPRATQLRVTVWGSGSCPAVGSGALVSGDGTTVRLLLRSYLRISPALLTIDPRRPL